jgi:hypothetical protein
MLMVVRIKGDEDILREWIGRITNPSELSNIVATQLEYVQQQQPTFLYRMTIQTDCYGA